MIEDLRDPAQLRWPSSASLRLRPNSRRIQIDATQKRIRLHVTRSEIDRFFRVRAYRCVFLDGRICERGCSVRVRAFEHVGVVKLTM
jgi:hypothetical protein